MPNSREASDGRGIWFKAKRYGWGFGLPVAWQGWAVLAGWLVAVVAGDILLVPEHPALHVAFVLAMIAVLVAVCWAKGSARAGAGVATSAQPGVRAARYSR